MPEAIKRKNVAGLLEFEKKYEVIGLPALLLLVITGIWMSLNYGIPLSQWLSFSSGIETVVSCKLLLLIITFVLALHARLVLIPNLKPERLVFLTLHIFAVTAIGITMLILGTFVRYGGI
ncbi:MAG: CopD family protein [Chitinophagales bacterium]